MHTGIFGKSNRGKTFIGAALASIAGMFGLDSSPEQKKYETAFGEKKNTRTISIPLNFRRGFTLGGQRKTKYTRCELYGKKKGHSRGRYKGPKIDCPNGIH